jgi:biopolymer transport protein ExbD
MRRVRRADPARAEDLNLVPYLDIVVNLVMFLLLVTNFAAPLTEIRLPVPADGVGDGVAGDTLVVSIEAAGYSVTGIPGWEVWLPRKSGVLDADGLGDHLSARAAEGARPLLTITADDAVPLDQLVATLDAIRETPDGASLFPAPRLAKR